MPTMHWSFPGGASARRLLAVARPGAALVVLLVSLVAGAAHAGPITRLSVPDDPLYFGIYPDRGAVACSLSQTGRYAAFVSDAANMVAGDTNATNDTFVHDRIAQTTRRASVGTDGGEATSGGNSVPSISADGRWVAFVSGNDLFGLATPNGRGQVLLRDTVAGETRLVSRGIDGGPGDESSGAPMVSADGAFVVFESRAANLVAPTSTFRQVYRYAVATGVLERVSVDAHGNNGNRDSTQPSIASDGQRVAFLTEADNLLTDGAGNPVADANGTVRDAVFKSYPAGRVRLASLTPGGAQLTTSSSLAVLSGDGNSVAFLANDPALRIVPSAVAQLYVRRIPGAATLLASTNPLGVEADAIVRDASLSDDGAYVAFQTEAGNLVAGQVQGELSTLVHDVATLQNRRYGSARQVIGMALSGNAEWLCVVSSGAEAGPADRNGTFDAYVFHVASGNATLVGRSEAPLPVTWANGFASSMDAAGARVAFAATARNLLPIGDPRTGLENLFLHGGGSGPALLLRPASGGVPLAGALGEPRLSADGDTLLFTSFDPRITGDSTGHARTLLRVRLEANGAPDDASLRDITPSTDGLGLDEHVLLPSVSGDGDAIAFVSKAGNLLDSPDNGMMETYLWRDGVGLRRISRGHDGSDADGDSERAVVNRDGRCVAFVSRAANLVPGGVANANVFLHDVAADTVRLLTPGPATHSRHIGALAVTADCTQVYLLSDATDLVTGIGNGDDSLLYRIDVATAQVAHLPLARDALADGTFALSGDGRWLLLADPITTDPRQLWRLDTATLSLRAITPAGAADEPVLLFEASVSDDGEVAAFSALFDALVTDPPDRNQSIDVYRAAIGDTIFDDGFDP